MGKQILAAIFQPTLSEELQDGTVLIHRVSVINDWSQVHGEWTLIAAGKSTIFHIRHWLYSGQEFRELLTSVGFTEISLCGTHDKTPLEHQPRYVDKTFSLA